MNVVRTAGRACFAAFFVMDGLQMAQRTPDAAAGAQAVLDKVMPVVRRIAPSWVVERLPADAVAWSKAVGMAELTAGLCYGMNAFSRPAAAALALASVPQVLSGLASDSSEERRDHMLRGLALLGAALVATQEKPRRRGLVHRALRGFVAVDALEARAVRRVGSAAASGARAIRARKQAPGDAS